MDKTLETINILLDRLERLSADSVWAHQASGLRGSLLRASRGLRHNPQDLSMATVDGLIGEAHEILAKAAGEIPGDRL